MFQLPCGLQITYSVHWPEPHGSLFRSLDVPSSLLSEGLGRCCFLCPALCVCGDHGVPGHLSRQAVLPWPFIFLITVSCALLSSDLFISDCTSPSGLHSLCKQGSYLLLQPRLWNTDTIECCRARILEATPWVQLPARPPTTDCVALGQ